MPHLGPGQPGLRRGDRHERATHDRPAHRAASGGL